MDKKQRSIFLKVEFIDVIEIFRSPLSYAKEEDKELR